MDLFPRLKIRRLAALAAAALGLAPLALVAAEPAPAPPVRIESSKMLLVFEEGWLVEWQNKETGEGVRFGRPALPPAAEPSAPYRPGAWWVPRAKGVPAPRVEASFAAKAVDAVSAEVVQSVTSADEGGAHAVQWAVNIPFEQVDAVHFPYGLGPARIASKEGVGDCFKRPCYYFNDRPGALSFHQWRDRFYLIQGQKGGLLVYVDDPALDHRPALEWKTGEKEMLVSNRSIKPTPWSKQYTGCRWVVRQYNGWVNEGVQVYRDYLQKAYAIPPLKDRPTAWVEKLAYGVMRPAWNFPLSLDATNPQCSAPFQYAADWDKSIAFHEQSLKNLAKVVNPDQVFFYCTAWNYAGMDTGYPDPMPDPFFSAMCNKVRQMGFHVMLHVNATWCFDDSTWRKYIAQQNKLLGRDPLYGVVHCALRNWVGDRPGREAPPFAKKLAGLEEKSRLLFMTPASETWREAWTSSVVSILKATGADMVHLDVPSITIDQRGDLYGMNDAQGLREMLKLLRRRLAKSGLSHVAVSTEVTPSEPILPYVDMCQSIRTKSILQFLQAAGEEELLENQADKAAKKLEAEKAKGVVAQKPFNTEAVRQLVAKSRELGEPAVGSMLTAGWIVGYPHAGSLSPLIGFLPNDPNNALHDRVIQAMDLWWGFTSNALPYGQFGWYAAFQDCAPFNQDPRMARTARDIMKLGARKNGKIFSSFDYTRFALVRFWQEQGPVLAEPRLWQKGDLACYSVKGGRLLRVTRVSSSTLRFALEPGGVLAEMDLFEGWKNHEALMKAHEPTWLRNQVDELAAGASPGKP